MSALHTLSDDDTLKSLVAWQVVEEVSLDEFMANLKLSVEEECRSQEVEIKHLEKSASGLSSYDLFFLVPFERRYGNIEGVAVLQSCFIRVAAVGVMKGYFSPNGCAYGGVPPEDIVATAGVQAPLLRAAIRAVRKSNHHLLTKEEALSPLPIGMVPFEYCFGQKPWNRVFHALYSNTD